MLRAYTGTQTRGREFTCVEEQSWCLRKHQDADGGLILCSEVVNTERSCYRDKQKTKPSLPGAGQIPVTQAGVHSESMATQTNKPFLFPLVAEQHLAAVQGLQKTLSKQPKSCAPEWEFLDEKRHAGINV